MKDEDKKDEELRKAAQKRKDESVKRKRKTNEDAKRTITNTSFLY